MYPATNHVEIARLYYYPIVDQDDSFLFVAFNQNKTRGIMVSAAYPNTYWARYCDTERRTIGFWRGNGSTKASALSDMFMNS